MPLLLGLMGVLAFIGLVVLFGTVFGHGPATFILFLLTLLGLITFIEKHRRTS